MSELNQLEKRIERLEKQLKELPQKMLRDVTRMVQMHTHELGGPVVWKIPPGEIRSVLEEKQAGELEGTTRVPSKEHVTVTDSLIIKKGPAKVD